MPELTPEPYIQELPGTYALAVILSDSYCSASLVDMLIKLQEGVQVKPFEHTLDWGNPFAEILMPAIVT
jgi:hypothetical protein